jgi:hypothetical protein
MAPWTLSIVHLDARGIARDRVALATILLSALGTGAIAALGLFQARLPGWSDWFPFVVAVTLVGGPGAFGFLFGLLMVEEGDTGVRDALSVTPVPPSALLAIRTVVATSWMLVWPLASVYLMNLTWRSIELSFAEWLAVVGPLALFTPALALAIPGAARDKVGALAVFKGMSFLMLAPLALYFLSEEAWYRVVFLVSPAGWVMESYVAFLNRRAGEGYGWALGGTTYAIVLMIGVVVLFRRKIHRLSR